MRAFSSRGVALAVGLALAAVGASCRGTLDPDRPPRELSAFGLFAGEARRQLPAEGVIAYAVNTPLFSDHATKLRFVKLPAGASAHYTADGPFDFPVGTLLAKTFAYPRPGGDELRLVETRILWHTEEGWIGLPYVWNEAQDRAVLEIAGETVPVRFADPSGTVHGSSKLTSVDYRVPNTNQCKGCHRVDGDAMSPIGPRASQLNGPVLEAWRALDIDNQLEHWVVAGALEGAPASEEAPRWPVWDQPETGSLDRRARAWLDVNCAHCHNPRGPARTSNLDLRFANTDPTLLGVYKSPVAAGRGSGEALHDIEPGRPDRSILVYRLESVDPGVMMPELGRSLVDPSGIALIREWIAEMEDPFAASNGAGTEGPSG